jgi:hypothetical protein
VSIVRMSDWYTGFGSRAFIAVLLKTFEPKSLSAETSEKESGFEMGLYVVTASMA